MIQIDNPEVKHKPESVYETPVYKIGKTLWYMAVYDHPVYERRFTRYVFQKYPGIWVEEKEHPNYNHNNGTTAGLPKTLRSIWERHYPKIKAALDGEPVQSLQQPCLF